MATDLVVDKDMGFGYKWGVMGCGSSNKLDMNWKAVRNWPIKILNYYYRSIYLTNWWCLDNRRGDNRIHIYTCVIVSLINHQSQIVIIISDGTDLIYHFFFFFYCVFNINGIKLDFPSTAAFSRQRTFSVLVTRPN